MPIPQNKIPQYLPQYHYTVCKNGRDIPICYVWSEDNTTDVRCSSCNKIIQKGWMDERVINNPGRRFYDRPYICTDCRERQAINDIPALPSIDYTSLEERLATIGNSSLTENTIPPSTTTGRRGTGTRRSAGLNYTIQSTPYRSSDWMRDTFVNFDTPTPTPLSSWSLWGTECGVGDVSTTRLVGNDPEDVPHPTLNELRDEYSAIFNAEESPRLAIVDSIG